MSVSHRRCAGEIFSPAHQPKVGTHTRHVMFMRVMTHEHLRITPASQHQAQQVPASMHFNKITSGTVVLIAATHVNIAPTRQSGLCIGLRLRELTQIQIV